MMALLLLLVILATAGLVVWTTFVRWEREGHREYLVATVFAVILVDLLLYPSQNDVPPGLFRPVIAGQSFRLPELVLLLALGARLVVHGGPKRAGPVGLALLAWCLWYALSGLFGLANGHDLKDVLYEAKAILYIGGGIALLTGVDLGRMVSPRAIGRWFVWRTSIR